MLDRVHPVIERLGPVRAFRELRRDFSGVVFVLAAGDLVASFGFSLVFPFLTIYLVQRFGASAFEAGLVLSGYSVCSIFSGAAGGWLADRIGRRIVMIVSVGVTGGVVALMGQATDLTQIALLTIALGLIDPAFIPAARAAIADVVPEDRRPRAYGLLSVAASVGWIAGPAIGAGLASLGYSLLFSVAGAIIALYVVIGWIWLPETRPTGGPAGTGVGSGRTGALAAMAPSGADPEPDNGVPQPARVDPRLVFVAFLPIALVVHAATFQWVTTFPIHAAKDLGMPTSQWGLLFSLNGILIVLFQMRVSGAAERRSKPRMMAIAALLYAAGYAVVGPVGGSTFAIPAIAALVVLVTFGEMFLYPLEASFVADLSPEDRRGRYQGIVLAATGLGSAVGPPLGGWLLDTLPAFIWWLTGASLVACAGAFVALDRLARRLPPSAGPTVVPIGGTPGAPELAG